MTTTPVRPVEQRIHSTSVQLRDVDTTSSLSYLEGRAVPYDDPEDIGWFIESFRSGSLAKSITEAARSLPLLLFHDSQSLPIGHASEWREESDGLHGIWKLDKGDVAQRAARMAQPDEAGNCALGYLSIRFQPIRSEWTYVDDWNPDLGPNHKDSVVRTEARLVETSLVSTPAYRNASVSFVRTAERAISREASGRELKGWREYLERERARAGR